MLIPMSRLLLFLLILLGYTAFVFILATRTDLIRMGPKLDSGHSRPYSLGRFQMLLWFYLTTVAYVFIWLLLGEESSINGSVVILAGISSGTALGSVLRDNQRAATPDSAAPALLPPPLKATFGFIHDVLYENNAMSLHRLQMLVWTLILALVFTFDVYYRLNMPEFNNTLLTFMGLSSGTFLAFKGSPDASGVTTPSGDDSIADAAPDKKPVTPTGTDEDKAE